VTKLLYLSPKLCYRDDAAVLEPEPELKTSKRTTLYRAVPQVLYSIIIYVLRASGSSTAASSLYSELRARVQILCVHQMSPRCVHI